MSRPSDHAGLMDKVYSSHRHFYDLTRRFYLFGRDRVIRDLAPPPGGTVLEVGCGTARNLIAAARKWPNARFYGLDISQAMLDTAGASLERKGLGGKVVLEQADASKFDGNRLFGIDRFDRIFMSYTLSMIPDWVGTIERGAAQLAPGGELHIVDFGQYERLPRLAKRIHFKSLNDFHVEPRREMPAVLRRVAEEHGLTLDFRSLWRGYAWQAALRKA